MNTVNRQFDSIRNEALKKMSEILPPIMKSVEDLKECSPDFVESVLWNLRFYMDEAAVAANQFHTQADVLREEYNLI